MVANVLLLDDSVVARCAMQGILTRGHHRCAAAATEAEAWSLLRSAVAFDLVIVEATLKGGSGLDFIQRLRGDSFLRPLPAVVYSNSCEQRLVRRAIGLRSQNYLLKPYDERIIYTEVTKAATQRWRSVTFEEEQARGLRTGLELDALRRHRLELRTSLADHAKFLEACAENGGHTEAMPRMHALGESAREAGFPGLVDYVASLQAAAEEGKWAALAGATEVFEFAGRMMFCQMNPGFVPDVLRTDEERQVVVEIRERARWAGVDLKSGIRPFSRTDWEAQVDGLAGCPVIDSVAASFQMLADSRATALNQLMDVVSRDPGLSAHVLAAANHLPRGGETTPVEDARTAASLLGGLKLHALSLALPKIAERHLRVAPMTWPTYWMFQVGVARMTQHVCSELELGQLGTAAYNAGLLHDLGRLLLLRLQPLAWPAIFAHAQRAAVTVAEAERLYLDCTTRDLGARFVVNQGLPPAYAHVIRWVEAPDEAPADAVLTAIVSLARHLCLHQRVGDCGDVAREGTADVEDTPAWRVLRQEMFPSFDVRKFEARARAHALRLRQELLGRVR
ncbi:MAG: HDOD domain-containing protein [Verrucomicrobia bacterium]|nr:HDOD domain-containing protein [Verrucomicrobiota bacterium]